MASFFSSLSVKRTARKVYRTREQARAEVFDYIKRFYRPRRRHSTIGYLSIWNSRKPSLSLSCVSTKSAAAQNRHPSPEALKPPRPADLRAAGL